MTLADNGRCLREALGSRSFLWLCVGLDESRNECAGSGEKKTIASREVMKGSGSVDAILQEGEREQQCSARKKASSLKPARAPTPLSAQMHRRDHEGSSRD
mmetsp:Transcript_22652/g.55901  ORF Transcript_22652/g.55901 Transcript_22652/m.55901 type:complete len:101 (-) Transcript_22652:88-390(-)